MGRYAIFNGLVYGGGTDIIPNPEGTPTDELHSLQIGDDIYEIVGGGGSGGNASLDATTLYDTPITTTGTYTLADDYNNYDFIGFKAGNGSTETDIRLYAVKDIQDSMNDNLVITNNVTNSWFNFTINADELTIPGKTVSTIYSVIGYKIKGGGGSTDKVTKVYDAVPSGDGCSIVVAEHIWLKDSGGSVSYSTAEYPDITSVDNFIARLTQTAMDDGSRDYDTNITFTFDETNKTIEMSWDTLSGSSGCYVDIVYSLVEPVVVANDVEVSNTNTVTYDISSIIPAYQTLASKDFMFNLKHIYSDNDGLGTSSPFNINFNSNTGVLTVSWNDIGTNNVLTGDILLLYKEDGYKLIKDMQPPTETSSGYHGYVPAPKIGDENKFLRGDGTWSEGGNSNVEANPAGTPTDTLNTIGIDGTIYNIEGSGGGGSSFIMDELYTGTSEVPSSGSTVSLSKSIANYDFIMFDIGQNPEHTHQFFTPDSLYDSTNECILFATNGGYCDVYASTSMELTFGNRKTFDARLLYSVYGLKFGSSGGGSQELISYDTTITTTQYGWWTVEDKDGNTLDPDQYELVTVTPIVNNSPSWTGAWDGAFYINSVDGVTDRYDVTFVNINDGGYIRTSRTWDIKVVYRDKNAAGGGGGSTVVPNPQEEPTDTLNTVEIDGVVYNIEGGSEGEGVEIYSEDEYIVGKWIDGKKLYQRTYYLAQAITVVGGGTWTDTGIDISDIETLVDSKFSQDIAVWDAINGINDNGVLKATILASGSLTVDTITLRYTKTVETPAPAWGGSVNNYYANFIDTNKIIDSGSYQGSFTYTATEDCFINIAVVMSANDSATITIDGALVTSGWCASLNTINPILPLKKGQTLVATASASNTSDYTVYGISYASGSGGTSEGEGVEIYSEDEYIVGKWVDGKKLYQKTFIWNENITGSVSKSISLDNPDYAFIYSASGINSENALLPIPYTHSNSSNNIGVFISSTKDSIGFRLEQTLKKVIITIRYTKTVETPAPAWGGSVTNNYASFIDTDNVIYSTVSSSASDTYTATEDCYIMQDIIVGSNVATVQIDGETVAEYSFSGTQLLSYNAYLKRGQTITVTHGATSAHTIKVFGISYGSGGSSSGSSKIEYSTEEKKIGTWTDGKPIYEKIIINDNLTDTSTVPHAMYIGNIPNDVDIILPDLSVSVCDSTHRGWVTGGGICTVSGWNFGLHITDNKVVLYGDSASAIQGGMAIVKIRYTKTTT